MAEAPFHEAGAALAALRPSAEAALERALERAGQAPPSLLEALRYPVQAGGKRLRPCLVSLTCSGCGGAPEQAWAAMAAVELIHTYSLVHDDLPCMDDDDLRRGRPTTHRVYGEATAVLVGDALQALAFEVLAAEGGPQAASMVAVLARASGPVGMVGGQALDLAAEGSDAGEAEVFAIHRAKTAALIAASVELGALAAGVREPRLGALRAFGWELGLLFQVVDDLLDVTASEEALGKTPGKDAEAGKRTVVAVLGLEGARARACAMEDSLAGLADAAGLAATDPLRSLPAWVRSRSS